MTGEDRAELARERAQALLKARPPVPDLLHQLLAAKSAGDGVEFSALLEVLRFQLTESAGDRVSLAREAESAQPGDLVHGFPRQDVLILLAGIPAQDTADLARRLILSADDPLTAFWIVEALGYRGVARDGLPEFDPPVKADAMNLRTVGCYITDEAGRDLLIEILRKRDLAPSVRQEIIGVAGRFQPGALIDPWSERAPDFEMVSRALIEECQQSSDSWDRQLLFGAMGYGHSILCRTFLMESLGRATSWDERTTIIRGLELWLSFGDEQVYAEVLKVAESAGDARECAAALMSLRPLPGREQEFISRVVPIAKNSPHRTVRQAAVQALRMAGPSALREVREIEVLDSDVEVRSTAQSVRRWLESWTPVPQAVDINETPR